jgi:hypothetical protein
VSEPFDKACEVVGNPLGDRFIPSILQGVGLKWTPFKKADGRHQCVKSLYSALLGDIVTCRHEPRPFAPRLSIAEAGPRQMNTAPCAGTAGQSGTTGYREPVDLPELLVADAAEWRTWLRGHHSKSQGVWLVLAKKGTTHPTTLSYDQALDEAICFGWIDGQLGRRDNATFRRRFTPRNARSPWSQRNVAIAERLSASGRMRWPGVSRHAHGTT